MRIRYLTEAEATALKPTLQVDMTAPVRETWHDAMRTEARRREFTNLLALERHFKALKKAGFLRRSWWDDRGE